MKITIDLPVQHDDAVRAVFGDDDLLVAAIRRFVAQGVVAHLEQQARPAVDLELVNVREAFGVEDPAAGRETTMAERRRLLDQRRTARGIQPAG